MLVIVFGAGHHRSVAGAGHRHRHHHHGGFWTEKTTEGWKSPRRRAPLRSGDRRPGRFTNSTFAAECSFERHSRACETVLNVLDTVRALSIAPYTI
jgi:hypothetical protein